MRLNQYLAKCGLGTRRECDKIISSGDIQINGIVISDFSYQVQRNDKVIFKGKRIFSKASDSILYNKERNIHTNFQKGEVSLVSLLKELKLSFLEGYQSLRKEDCGVQIVTNDLELLNSNRAVSSVFHIFLTSPLSLEQEELLQNSLQNIFKEYNSTVLNSDRTELGLEVEVSKMTDIYSCFTEHQISIEYLDRVMMNGVSKKDLNRGFYRKLEEKELIRLKHF